MGGMNSDENINVDIELQHMHAILQPQFFFLICRRACVGVYV